MGDRATPPETPIPRRLSALERAVAHEHECVYPDGPVLIDYVRQHRRRAWWLSTVVALALVLSLGTIAVWIYQTGTAVGATQRDLIYMQRSAEADHAALGRVQADVLAAERQAAERQSSIEQALIRIDSRLTRIEESLSRRR